MDAANPTLAETVLAIHLAVIGFNIFGLVVIPLGGWRGWRFVHLRWWRWLHVGAMGVVAAQALAGRACFLTLLESQLAGSPAAAPPLIMGFINRLVFWPLPLWMFTAAYVALFVYVIVLLKLVPANLRGRTS